MDLQPFVYYIVIVIALLGFLAWGGLLETNSNWFNNNQYPIEQEK